MRRLFYILMIVVVTQVYKITSIQQTRMGASRIGHILVYVNNTLTNIKEGENEQDLPRPIHLRQDLSKILERRQMAAFTIHGKISIRGSLRGSLPNIFLVYFVVSQ